MLVKKKKSSWTPSEKKDLKVGDIIEITDPRTLILNGDVVAVGTEGEEISAYELYGVLVKDEREEFEEYLKVKKATAMKEQLEKEAAELKALQKEAQEKLAQPKTEVVEEAKVAKKK